jgi:UDP-hydrolysing UDP-N-acetyl-D-glucosamine 2-epimerase
MGGFGMKKRKICVVLTTRGNYAKMKSVIQKIRDAENLELQLVLGGMVVLEKYGRIFDTLSDTHLVVNKNINFVIEGEDLVTMTKSSGLAVTEFATVCQDLEPDIVIIIADRFECLSFAMAAAYMNITVAHVEGGEVSGSIDESIRHAITKLSHIHFPASAEAGKRIEMMGENSDHIHVVGGTSMDMLRGLDLDNLAPFSDLQRDFGMGAIQNLTKNGYLVLIQHPVTTEYEDNFKHIQETIEAVKEIAMPVMWIMPNMDAGSDGINKGIRQFREREHPQFVHFFKSLPIEYYAPLLNNAACILGNSSSGIRESEYLGTPAVNIGTRQHGRERGNNVIDVGYSRAEIVDTVKIQIKHGKYKSDYLYGDGYASSKIVNILQSCELVRQKTITY